MAQLTVKRYIRYSFELARVSRFYFPAKVGLKIHFFSGDGVTNWCNHCFGAAPFCRSLFSEGVALHMISLFGLVLILLVPVPER